MDAHLDIWVWSLTGTTSDEGILSPDEQARAARFVKPADQQAYRLGRTRMRRILADYVGSPARALSFAYNAHGKPSLDNGPSFNLSHSAGIACLAVHPTHPLGADIEAFRHVEDGVARRFFSAKEYAELSALPPHLWQAGFFRCWTRKEAFVKACGPGLSMPLDSFDVTLTPDQAAQITRIEGQSAAEWRLLHLDFNSTAPMVGAVALHASHPPQWRVLGDADLVAQVSVT